MDENKSNLLEIPQDSIVVNVNSISEDFINKYSPVIKNRNYWHAFLVYNVGNRNRNEVLRIILNNVYPEALLPTHFRSKGSDCTFLARNCCGAIFKLLDNQLVIPDPTDASKTWTCELILKFSTISNLPLPTSNISTVLELLFEDTSKTLNLEKFSDNEGLTEYNPLSQPKLLCFALRISNEMKPTCIKLNNNEIKTLSPFEVLRGINSVKVLDLRNNLIEFIEELEYLKVFDLVELWLDGNPLCEKYDAFSYGQSVKEIMPMLEKLDGVSISFPKLPIPQQNFLCSNEGFDLVDQFVNHFFSLYDSKRKLLRDLYHPNAMFSMTIESGQVTLENDRLHVYRAFSRNMLKPYSSTYSNPSAIGIIKIMETFSKLPGTKHNKQTFSVDLFHYSERLAVLSIIGTYSEDSKPCSQSTIIFGFKRTFTLIKHDCEYTYVICNDLLHVYEASKIEWKDTFGDYKVNLKTHPFDVWDKNKAEETMSRITGVNRAWIKRFLEDSNYNIIEFLKTFIGLLKRDQIPQLAYSQTNQCSGLVEWLIPKMIEFGMAKFENSLQQEALHYITSNPSFLRSLNLLSKNWSSTEASREAHEQYWMQNYGCQNSEMSLNSNYHTVQSMAYQYEYATHTSEYSFQSSEILQYHIPHPKKDRNKKRTISDVENVTETQNKKKVIHIKSVSKTNLKESIKNTDNNLISKYNEKTYNRSNLILVSTQSKKKTEHISLISPIKSNPQADVGFQKNNKISEDAICKEKLNINIKSKSLELHTPMMDPTKSATQADDSLEKSNKSSEDAMSKRNTNTDFKINAAEFAKGIMDIVIRPKLALLGGKWTYIEDCDQYDFQLLFKNWILVQKGIKGNWISKQDDFQKNFTCWKKHFPTYSNEELSHSLHASCISSHFKSVFNTIESPVTYWDFPATVPDDIRPPKKVFLPGGTEKLITPGCGYGFVSVKMKWKLVRNNANKWMLVHNKRNVLWQNNRWIIEPSSVQKKFTDMPYFNKVIETAITLNNKLEEDTMIICDQDDPELNVEDLCNIEKSIEEEIKNIYPADTEPEQTITTSYYAFHLSQSSEKCIKAPENSNQSDVADLLIKWKKIFEFVPYIPTIALIDGSWTVVSENANLKFHRTEQNKWVLLEKKSGTNKWQVVDDFYVKQEKTGKESRVQLYNKLSKNIFDNIALPVTMYDFPTSVSLQLLPPKKLVIDNEIIKVTPDSDYAYVSINGKWIAVKKNEQMWVAVNNVDKTIVAEKMVKFPVRLTDKKAVEFESKDDNKISSATCTLLQIVTGTKLVKPLTYTDIEGSEEKRPPRLALTEVNGEQHWHYVMPDSGKGFVLEDGVWVKVVLSSGEWKASMFTAYQGCIVGYYLFNNIWVTMKKHILGGKWSPISNIETTPITYWNCIGPEELKPPRKIFVAESEKVVHNNSNMGFLKKGDVWILMEKKDGEWNIVKENANYCIYQLIHGIWRMIKENSTAKWSLEPNKQKLVTYQNFSGLKEYAPPKEIGFLERGNKIKKTIDQSSDMGFILNNGVWVLMQKKNANLTPVKNSNGQANFGYKRVDGKFRIIRMNENGKWMNVEQKIQQKVVIHESITLNQRFKNATPLTFDRIHVDLPDNMKPPKYALIKNFIKNKICWHLVDENSGYGFIRENDIWLLMKWTSDKQWVNSSEDHEVEYRYKIINNSWVPMTGEHGKWIPLLDPNTIPIIPDLCIKSPEKDLPNKIKIQTNNSKSIINVIPSYGMGYMKYLDEYVLMRRMNGEWVIYEHSSDTALIFKMSNKGKWKQSTRCINSFNIGKSNFDSDKIHENEKISTYNNTSGTNYIKPPQYIKMMEGSLLKWKEININDGFGFVKRKYWILVKKIEENWMIVNHNEGYNIIDNRWMIMTRNKDKWIRSCDPCTTPRCNLDSVNNSDFPIRVIMYEKGHPKYINTANDCSLGFIMDKSKVCILMQQHEGSWITMKDDFLDAPTMAFKLINHKWQRVKKDINTDQWILCTKQFDLPVLHIDIIDKPDFQPPTEISVIDLYNKEHKMCFNIFSNEGFIKQQDVWVLKKPTQDGWSNYPGIFGCYGYKVVGGNLIVMEEKNGRWEVYNHINISILHPVTYRETESWPEIERPPMVFFLQHTNTVVNAHETRCQYGFVKDKDVWLVARNVNGIWSFEKSCNKHVAYKLIDNRWVTMKINNLNDWIPTFNPVKMPYTHFNTSGKFEERPPLRIILDGLSKWTTICTSTKLGFSKDNDMWIVMKKKDNNWIKYSNDGKQLGYKIVNGQWRRFTKSVQEVWKICTKAIAPVLSYDFNPKNKNAPPSSLCFGCFLNGKSKSIKLGLFCGKGFIEDNGAWVLMENCLKVWKKVNRFPWLFGTFAYMLKKDVWNIVKKDFDGSWKSGFINNEDLWIYHDVLSIPVQKPVCYQAVEKLPLQERPPEMFIIYIDAMPKIVSLKSVGRYLGFQFYKGAWVLLKKKKHWKIAGGGIAYKLINNRWVTMKMEDHQWVPLYDPNTTPITHFECTDPLDYRPPLRIVLNENGKDNWKVIFQHSGYGFIKNEDKWILMKKLCDGTWEKHRDCVLEFTSYKMIDKQWTRLKKGESSDWMRMDSTLPLLQCDFSLLHDQKPPPSFEKTFVIDPQNIYPRINTFLDLYSKFGYRKENNVWILMKSDSVGSWSEYKFHPKETDLFGYMFNGAVWKLLRKEENSQWATGKLEHLIGDSWKFIKEEIEFVNQSISDESFVDKDVHVVKNAESFEDNYEYTDKNNQKMEDASIGKDHDRLRVKYDTKTADEVENVQITELHNKNEQEDPSDEKKADENEQGGLNGNEHEVNEENKIGVNAVNKIIIEEKNALDVCDENNETVEVEIEQKVNDENKSIVENKIESDNKLVSNNQNKKTDVDKNEMVNNTNIRENNDVNSVLVTEIENSTEVKDDEYKKTSFTIQEEQEYENQIKSGVKYQNMKTVENQKSPEVLTDSKQKMSDNTRTVFEKENKLEGNDERKFEDKYEQGVENPIENGLVLKKDEDENGKGINDLNLIKQEEDPKDTLNENTGQRSKKNIEDQNEQKVTIKNEQTCIETSCQQKGNGKEIFEERVSPNNLSEIPITNPVKYHEFVEFPIENKPPKTVCLKIRGIHRRISLASKKSKIGFQLHNGVWVLLESLSGNWKILHNSAGFPIAYKLIDNRWVSMRIDSERGSWMPTFNPITTPRTYFESECSEDIKPPRRVIFNEKGDLKWKEISEFSGFGFLKNEDMWVLMKNSSNNNWKEYRNENQEICAFKIQDFKWTKFTQGAKGGWKISVDDLPVLNYDYIGNSEAAPPEFAPYALNIIKKKIENVGFQWDCGAWIMMQCNENHNWTPIFGTNSCGFVRSGADLWNVVKKDRYGKWMQVGINRTFQSILEDLFRVVVKRERETVESCIKKINMECIDPCSSLETNKKDCINDELSHIEIRDGSYENDSIRPITTLTNRIISTPSTQSSTIEKMKDEANESLPEESINLNQTVLCLHSHSEFRDLSHEESYYQGNNVDSSLIQEQSISVTDSEKSSSACNEQILKKVLKNQEKLNSVELYLAVKPDCCLGCPELQNLLREYRPSNVPNKIIRMKFRLPDGNTRMLSIPKAVTDTQKPSENQVVIRKRKRTGTNNSSNNKKKYKG